MAWLDMIDGAADAAAHDVQGLIDSSRAPIANAQIQRAYYLGFVAVLLVCFSPFKMLAYMAPCVFTAWMMIHDAGGRNRAIAMFFVVSAGAVFYELATEGFYVSNYVVAIVTYSSFLPLLLLDGRLLASRRLLRKLLGAASVLIGVQAGIGLVQAVYGTFHTGTFSIDNGDYVEGSIHLPLNAERAAANPMFAINMSLMLLACLSLPEVFEGKRRNILIVGTLALVLASVLHALIFLIAAVSMAFILTRTREQTGRGSGLAKRVLMMIVIVSGLSYIVLPENVANITKVAEKALDLDAVDIPRAVLLTRVITDLPGDAPLQPAVGLGPGQFSSRASLIMSGVFLGGPQAPKTLPLFSPQATRLADEYCIALLTAFSDTENPYIGSSQQPFFSFLSLYTETGLFGLALLAGFLLRFIRQLRSRIQARPEWRLHAFVLCAGSFFVVLLGLQENYWEMPQALLIGLLLLKVLHAEMMYPSTDAGL